MAWAIILCPPASLSAEGVKTYFKKYKVFTFGNADYLCEPYLVKKDDWLYKIFRQKGEISASDFPRFLTIFRKLNPKLSNIDAIAPGHQILIPLKRVVSQSYQQQETGTVSVPVIEFSPQLQTQQLAQFIRSHTIQSGDTVSALLDKDFLKKGGGLSAIGKHTFTTLNPDIVDVNWIYPGTQILLPDPEILSQPWFKPFLAHGAPAGGPVGPPAPVPPPHKTTSAPLSGGDLIRLKRYAQLIHGTLMHQGTMHFPGQNGAPGQVLNLSATPVLEEENGRKNLMLPPNPLPSQVDQDLLVAMRAYWKDLRLREADKLIRELTGQPKSDLDGLDLPGNQLIDKLVFATGYTYKPDQKIPIALNNVPISVTMGRLIHPDQPDLLVNNGKVYGKALETIGTQGYGIITLTPEMTPTDICLELYSKLGYGTWKNPAFNAGNRVETIYGIYASKNSQKLLIVRNPPSESANRFLAQEGIQIVILEETK